MELIHFLPCTVHSDGPAPVDRYFNIDTDSADPTKFHGMFRGRQLEGQLVQPSPEGQAGILLLGERVSSSHSESAWKVVDHPQRMIAWNHDTPPSHDDPLPRALEILNVAPHIHFPVTAEALEAQLAATTPPGGESK
ncbi:putative ribonuclease H2 subunit C [Paratrimastix pyriformis]|uniref:Ribonuclease H2 subunit C n=1 Tax=Paratrimastix pyriformis TaxID=342808 RepID=A0ABQ8UKZ8_9EUKA|nr:putative ribonuclease H2 subunit C [Paratrimastix pyriformis]